MQRFALLHDGTAQGWQATYMAFHIAALLGAPLQVLLIDSFSDKTKLAQRAAHVEVGGRAAGVAMETHLLMDYSMDTLKESITAIDGLFLPPRLISDGETVALFLDAFSCPLWITSHEPEIIGMVVLVNDMTRDAGLLSYAKTLSNRLQQSLTALTLKDSLESIPKSDRSDINMKWRALSKFSLPEITRVLDQLNAGLVMVSSSNTFRVENLPVNCIIYPELKDA